MDYKGILRRALRYVVKGVPRVIVTADVHYTSPALLLAGRRVVVTGGGRGLGFAMAKKFKDEGAEVLIAGRNAETLRRSSEQIGCAWMLLDVQNVASFKTFIDKAADMLGGIDCLVNNAGISLHESGFTDVSPEQFDMQFGTNLRGPFFLTQAFVEKCSADSLKGVKNVLFVSSETGMTVDERPYGLTKAALNSLVQGLAYRYVHDGFRINAVAPGITVSDMVGKNDDGDLSNGANITGRYYLPGEVAEVACFLLSDVSNCLNGQILVCNEGKTLNARWK